VAIVVVAEHKVLDADDALAVDEELKLTIGLTNVVELDPLADGRPLVGSEFELTTTDGSTVDIVAVCTLVVTELLVGSEAVRQVGVEFALTTFAPHQASRKAVVGTTST